MKQRSFVVYLLLNIVTCGIYGIYFWYVFTENLNQICAEKVPNDKPSMNFLLFLALPAGKPYAGCLQGIWKRIS